jgi:hypothetical protein
MRNITEMKKKRLERMIQFLLVLVASLTLTPGLYVPCGVSVRSELFSAPVTPVGSSSLFFCLRAASDLNVGRAMFGYYGLFPRVTANKSGEEFPMIRRR